MNFYPYDITDQRLKTDAKKVITKRGFIADFEVIATNAIAADTDGVHVAAVDTGVEQEITTAITNPAVARNITATAGGTATDIKAIQVIVEGTNYEDKVITETLPAFTADTAGTVQGSKAFKTVTKVTIPAHDGTGATTSIGFGDKLGLHYKLLRNSVLRAYLNDIVESTAPTVTTSATAIEDNTMDLNSALNGTKVNADIVVYGS